MVKSLLACVLLLALTSDITSSDTGEEVEELPEPASRVSHPYLSDLYPAGDGGGSSYDSYHPPSYNTYEPAPSYGYEHQSYGHGSDCGDLDLLGVLAGGAALAALGVYILVNQAAAARSGGTYQHIGLDGGTENVLSDLSVSNLADMTVNVTCYIAQRMSEDRSEYSLARQSSGDDCFSGLVGAIAGFAALGALIAYALFQAAQAAARSFSSPLGFDIDNSGLSLAARMALIFLQSESPECLPHQLCHLNQRARDSKPVHYFVTKLASLPAGWFLSSRLHDSTPSSGGDRAFLEFCPAITSSGTPESCDRHYPQCARS